MQNHDQQVAEFSAHVIAMCRHMSSAYLKTVFDQAELALVSQYQAENIVARQMLHGLRAMHAGCALKVIKNVREELGTPFRSKTITIRYIRGAEPQEVYAGADLSDAAIRDITAISEFNGLEMVATWCVRQEQAETAGQA